MTVSGAPHKQFNPQERLVEVQFVAHLGIQDIKQVMISEDSAAGADLKSILITINIYKYST